MSQATPADYVVPPPPSAPAEFLGAQWLAPPPSAGDEADTGRAVTPPPPSAPGEFLAGQWLAPPPSAGDGSDTGRAVTPPPPSAPSEFLEGQWRDAARDAPSHRGQGLAEFENALPAIIHSAEELERLASAGTQVAGSSPLEGREEDDEVHGEDPGTEGVRLRGVPLGKDEQVARVFLPDRGLVRNVPPAGQALILTNRRLIAFRGVEGFRDTHIASSAGIVQCSVRTGQRNWGAILQGIMIMVGGAFLYLIVGYWLAGQISGPSVPGLNIDVAPLIALLIILAGLFILLQNYFTRPAGAMIFHGEGLEIAFPFRSSLDLEQVYDFVALAHSAKAQFPSTMDNGDDRTV